MERTGSTTLFFQCTPTSEKEKQDLLPTFLALEDVHDLCHLQGKQKIGPKVRHCTEPLCRYCIPTESRSKVETKRSVCAFLVLSITIKKNSQAYIRYVWLKNTLPGPSRGVSVVVLCRKKNAGFHRRRLGTLLTGFESRFVCNNKKRRCSDEKDGTGKTWPIDKFSGKHVVRLWQAPRCRVIELQTSAQGGREDSDAYGTLRFARVGKSACRVSFLTSSPWLPFVTPLTNTVHASHG